MKKIISCALALSMLLAGASPAFGASLAQQAIAMLQSPAGAAAVASSSTAEKLEPISLSLEEAVFVMQNEGTNAETARLNRETDEAIAKGYSETVTTIKEQLEAPSALSNVPGGAALSLSMSSSLEAAGITVGNERMVRLQRDFAKAHIESNAKAEMNSLEAKTVEIYYGLLQARENLRVSQENLALQQEMYDNVLSKYEKGVVARINVLSAENALLNAKHSVRSAEAGAHAAEMNFNLQMGYALDQEVILTDALTVLDFPEITLEEAIASALEKRPEVDALSFVVDLQQQVMNSVAAVSNRRSSAYLKQQASLTAAKKAAADIPTQLEMAIRVSYESLQNLREAVDIAQAQAALAAESYRIALISFDAGVNTYTDVEEAEILTFQCNQAVLAAITNYDLAVYDFLYSIDVGTTRLTL